MHRQVNRKQEELNLPKPGLDIDVQVRQAFGLEQDSITAMATAEPVGCDGMNMLPYLAGERTPNWPHASGALLGLRTGSLRPGLLYRAAMEGATFSLLAGTLFQKTFVP